MISSQVLVNTCMKNFMVSAVSSKIALNTKDNLTTASSMAKDYAIAMVNIVTEDSKTAILLKRCSYRSDLAQSRKD